MKDMYKHPIKTRIPRPNKLPNTLAEIPRIRYMFFFPLFFALLWMKGTETIVIVKATMNRMW